MLNQWRTPSTSIWYSKSRNGRHWPGLLPQPPLERRTLAAAHIADERQRLETELRGGRLSVSQYLRNSARSTSRYPWKHPRKPYSTS